MKNLELNFGTLTKEEAAMRLGISNRGLERLMAARRIRYFKVGKRVVFRAEDIDAYLERCAVEPKTN